MPEVKQVKTRTEGKRLKFCDNDKRLYTIDVPTDLFMTENLILSTIVLVLI